MSTKRKPARKPEPYMPPAARAEHFREEANKAWRHAGDLRREADECRHKLRLAEATIEALAAALVAEKAKAEIPF